MKYTSPATLALAALILSSCGSSLESESGLYDVELHHSIKVPIDGWWSWGKGPVFREKKSGYVYIAPLDVSLVQEDEPELSALLVPQMHDYMIAYLTRVLDEANKANHTRWKITTDPSKADFRMNMAVVSLRPQRPVLRWIFFVGSFFSPIPGTGTIAGKFTNGDICIEFTIRNNRTGELLYAMKDSNRATTRLYKAEAYNSEGQADKNLQIWAQKIARLVRFYTSDKYSHQDISDVIDNTSVFRALFYRLETDVEDETISSQNAPEIEGPTRPAGTKDSASSKSTKGNRRESKASEEKENANSSAASQNAPELEGPTQPADEKSDSSAGSQNAPKLEGPTQAAPAATAESSKPRRSRRARTSETSEAKATDNTESPGKAAAPEAKSPASAEAAAKPEAATKPEPAAQPATKPEPAGEAKPEAPAASAAPEPAKPAASTDSPATPA